MENIMKRPVFSQQCFLTFKQWNYLSTGIVQTVKLVRMLIRNMIPIFVFELVAESNSRIWGTISYKTLRNRTHSFLLLHYEGNRISFGTAVTWETQGRWPKHQSVKLTMVCDRSRCTWASHFCFRCSSLHTNSFTAVLKTLRWCG